MDREQLRGQPQETESEADAQNGSMPRDVETEQQEHPASPSLVDVLDHEPITLVTSWNRRKYILPWEKIRIWEDARSLIERVCLRASEDEPNQPVPLDELEFLSADGSIILPEVWDMVVKPGWTVRLAPRHSRTVHFEQIRNSPSDRGRHYRDDSPDDPYLRDGKERVIVLDSGSSSSADSSSDSSSEYDSSDSASESKGEDQSVVSIELPPRQAIIPKDVDGVELSFMFDPTAYSQSSVGPSCQLSLKPGSSNIEALKIAEAYVTNSNGGQKYTIELDCLEGPASDKISEQPRIRWHHICMDVMDFSEFKNVSVRIPGLSLPVRQMTESLLEKIERQKIKTFIHGKFIDPGTVMRYEDSSSNTACSSIFLCIPHFALQAPAAKPPSKNSEFHPPRSLLQCYYPYEPTDERDKEQACRKYGNGSNELIHVPVVWMLKLGSEAVVTCSSMPLSDTLGPSIIPSVRSNSFAHFIKLTDLHDRTFLYSPHECRSYFELEQKIRELNITGLAPSVESVQIMHREGTRVQPLKIHDWACKEEADLGVPFISLSLANKIDEQNKSSTEDKIKESQNLRLYETPEAFSAILTWLDRNVKGEDNSQFLALSSRIPKEEELQNQLTENLAKLEKGLTTESLDLSYTENEVEKAFTSTKFYESVEEMTLEKLQSALPEPRHFQSDHSGNMSAHEAKIQWQKAAISTLASVWVHATTQLFWLFVPEKSSNFATRKCFGSMTWLLTIVREVLTSCGDTEDTISARNNRGPWIVVSLKTNQKLSAALPSDTPPVRSIEKCKACRKHAEYPTLEAAIEHLRKAHFESSEDVTIESDGARQIHDSLLVNWIRTTEQLRHEEENQAFIQLLQNSVSNTKELFSQTRDIVFGVMQRRSNGDIKPSNYRFPTDLLEVFRLIVIVTLAVERVAYFTHKEYDESTYEARGEQREHLTECLEVLETFKSSALTSLDEGRRQLCQMVRSEPGKELLYSLGPDFLLAWLVRRLLVKPLYTETRVADLYREYLSILRFQANHRPSKRLLRDINLLQEELAALNQINEWQMNAVINYASVLDDRTYRVNSSQRRFLFEKEANVLSSCLGQLTINREEYQDMTNQCRPLTEKTKQSTEINEEDHGKAILVFTVVTIIFLPLSFVTSYLGMNTSDIRNMDNKQSLFWEIAVPLTAVTMGSILLVAYNGDEMRDSFFRFIRRSSGKDWSANDRGLSVAERKRIISNTKTDSQQDLSSSTDQSEFDPPNQRLPDLPLLYGDGRRLIGTKARDGLAQFGFQENQIQSMTQPGRLPQAHLNQGRPSSFYAAQRPTYFKVHKDHIDLATLRHYSIPFAYDSDDNDYYIILREMPLEELDILFDHTRRLLESGRDRDRDRRETTTRFLRRLPSPDSVPYYGRQKIDFDASRPVPEYTFIRKKPAYSWVGKKHSAHRRHKRPSYI